MCFSLSAPAEAQEEDQMNPPLAPNPVSKTLDLSELFSSCPNPNGSSVEGTFPFDEAPMPLAVAPPSGDVIYFCNPDGKEVQQFGLSNDDLALPWSSSSKDSRSWNSSSSRVSAVEPELWDSGQNHSPERNWLFSSDARESSKNEIFASAVGPSRVGAGLSNLGNTCFLNAILQCFTHTVPLVEGLRSCRHSASCDGDSDGFCVICALHDQIEHSLAASGGMLSPLKLVDNLNHFSSSFRRYQQEDAHEFMQCALDKLERCFVDFKKNNESFEDDNLVEKVFGGRLISKLRCCNCGHSSDTYEPLIDLSLEIENVDTLPSALESFTKVENIDANFRCDSCKEEVSMEKQLILDQTPSVAAFHLKRFKTDGTIVQKIDKHVNFPLELDLQPYTISNQNNNVPLKYNLYAVVVHIGFSSTSGHYFCYVRSAPDTWHKLDDSKVTRVSAESVLSREAYILFYAQQGTPWFSSIMESPLPCLDPIILNTSPKSVLDTVDSLYKSNPTITAYTVSGEASESEEFSKQQSDYSCQEKLEGIEVSDTWDASHGCEQFHSGPNQESIGLNTVRGEAGESKEFSKQQFDYSCKEKLQALEVNDAGDASHGSEQFPSGPNQGSVGLNASKDTTHAQMPLGNAILNDSALFDGNSHIEGVGSDKSNCCQEEVDFGGNNDGFQPLTPPGSPPDSPDRSYYIPRDHLKMENRGSCKRPTNKHMGDSERKAAVKYVSKMHGSRREAFLELVGCSSEASSNKKRKAMDSSLCKKGSSHSVPKKSNHTSVMRPVAAGISQ